MVVILIHRCSYYLEFRVFGLVVLERIRSTPQRRNDARGIFYERLIAVQFVSYNIYTINLKQ